MRMPCSWVTRSALALTVLGSAGLAGCADQLTANSAPDPAASRPAASPVSVPMTPEAIGAFLDAHDPTLSARRAEAERSGAVPSPQVIEIAKLDGDPESLVTAAGMIGADTHVSIDISRAPTLASWAGRTIVLKGYARRVFLETKGQYASLTNPTQRFSDVCGDGPTEGYLQKCERGTIFFDMNCYPASNAIWAESRHSVTWLFTTQPIDPTSDRATCADPIPGGGEPPVICNQVGAPNYGQEGECLPPPPARCEDPKAMNYGLTGDCTYPPPTCEDPWASNYGMYGTCTYPPPTCQDPSASNYGAAGTCTYPPPICWDPNAVTYGQEGACVYQPSPAPRCTDYNATNYGEYGACEYPIGPPPPPPGGGSNDWDDDPCEWFWWEDVCNPDGGGEEQSRRLPLLQRTSNGPATARTYLLVLVTDWHSREVGAVVRRFRRGTQYVDALYVPATSSNATDWARAVRILQDDRATAGSSDLPQRRIEVLASGSLRYSSPGTVTKVVAGPPRTAGNGHGLQGSWEATLREVRKGRAVRSKRGATGVAAPVK